jgi:Protein of unknown function (DUF3800)
MRYRLYLDESGDHSSSHATDVGKRYLGLIGAALPDDKFKEFAATLECLKETHLQYDPDEPPILHREDILAKRGCYGVLSDDGKRAQFNADLLRWVESSPCRIFAVVIDKLEHGKARYRTLKHPYHYCLHAMLERYCGWLKLKKYHGDVMAESRGKTEDMQLKAAYARVWSNGTRYMGADVFQDTLTSKELKVKPKLANIAGLQLADILAHPLKRDVLVAYKRIPPMDECFGLQICQAAQKKYNRHEWNGITKGYGRVFLA